MLLTVNNRLYFSDQQGWSRSHPGPSPGDQRGEPGEADADGHGGGQADHRDQQGRGRSAVGRSADHQNSWGSADYCDDHSWGHENSPARDHQSGRSRYVTDTCSNVMINILALIIQDTCLGMKW